MALPEKPLSRGEQFLSKIAGKDTELPEPRSRGELYLAAIAGMDVVLPEKPLSRFEDYLEYIAENGIGGSSDGYTLLASGEYTKADSADILSIPVSFEGTPKIIACRITNLESISDQSQAVAFIKRIDAGFDAGFRTIYPDGILNIAIKLAASPTISNIAESPENAYLNAGNTLIICNRVSAQTPWRKSTYTWYIFGEEASE